MNEIVVRAANRINGERATNHCLQHLMPSSGLRCVFGTVSLRYDGLLSNSKLKVVRSMHNRCSNHVRNVAGYTDATSMALNPNDAR